MTKKRMLITVAALVAASSAGLAWLAKTVDEFLYEWEGHG